MLTRAASGIDRFDELLDKTKQRAPTRMLVTPDEIGVATAMLACDFAEDRHRRDPVHGRRLQHHGRVTFPLWCWCSLFPGAEGAKKILGLDNQPSVRSRPLWC